MGISQFIGYKRTNQIVCAAETTDFRSLGDFGSQKNKQALWKRSRTVQDHKSWQGIVAALLLAASGADS